MKTWNDYKNHIKTIDKNSSKDMEEIENLAAIVGAMVKQRKALGISQRELSSICNIPQSSVARIESFSTIPNLGTLLKIMQPLGLTLTVSYKENKLQT